MGSLNGVTWTEEDDDKIRDFVLKQGTRWSDIQSTVLEERTVSSIRNRWQRIQKEGLGRNKCHKCGQMKRGHSCKAIAHAEPRVVTCAHTKATKKVFVASEHDDVFQFNTHRETFQKYSKTDNVCGDYKKSLHHVLYMCGEMGYDIPGEVKTSLKLKGVS